MIIKSFNGNMYYYNNFVGHIFPIKNESDVKEINNKYNKLRTINNFDIETVTNEMIYKYLYTDGNGFKQLIIELTDKCNLRCKYCIYSDHYEHTRSHGNTMMTFDTAKKAVDYYFENFKAVYRRNPLKKPIITFYGGEPLVNYKLLKEIVLYIKENYNKYDVSYNITVNGTLFRKEIQDFLVENKFSILVSLDGYKDNHNRNRVDINSEPTFDRIIENINIFKANHGEYQLAIASCFDYKTDISKMKEFFDKFDYPLVHIAQVQSSNGNYYNDFTEDDFQSFMKSYNEVKMEFFKQAEKSGINKESFLYRVFGSMYGDFAYHTVLNERYVDVKPYTGTCIPGEKIYVATNGDFKICEKINSSYKVGNVDSGLDLEAVSNVLNDYNKNICVSCSTCPISRLCKMCFKDFETQGNKDKKDSICKGEIEKMKGALTEYVSLLETNPTLFEEITIDYYNKLNEVGEFI